MISIEKSEYWNLRCDAEKLYLLEANGATIEGEDKEDYELACEELSREIYEGK